MEELINLGVWTAKRPPDSSLSTKKIQHKIGAKLVDIDTALETIKREKESSSSLCESF